MQLKINIDCYSPSENELSQTLEKEFNNKIKNFQDILLKLMENKQNLLDLALQTSYSCNKLWDGQAYLEKMINPILYKIFATTIEQYQLHFGYALITTTRNEIKTALFRQKDGIHAATITIKRGI